jgi:hypothetical protein
MMVMPVHHGSRGAVRSDEHQHIRWAEYVDRTLELRPALDVFAGGLLGVEASAAGGTKSAELAIKMLMDRWGPWRS